MDKLIELLNRRVLIVDDDAATHDDYRNILSSADTTNAVEGVSELAAPDDGEARTILSNFELDCALQGSEAVELVRHAVATGRPYAVAFVDMHMPPGWDGTETIEKLWALDPDLQVVLCCAYSDYDWMQIIARLGHADKLLTITMPFEPIEVLQCARALTRKWLNERCAHREMLALKEVVTAGTQGLEVANRQLRYMAAHDALTGLPNRILLEDRLAQAMISAEKYGRTLALVMVGLDRLKLINDTLGHRAGDELLREVGRRLATVIRDLDTVVRAGGDEFLMIVNPIEAPADAEKVAFRALEVVKAGVQFGDVEMHSTVSIGIAYFPLDGRTVESLIARAGAAMYFAKVRGRNNVQSFETGMDTQSRNTAQLQSDLHEALEQRQFELHYQPKVDVKTGSVHGAEALIRWRHPVRGLISPAEFIPFAEDCGLIGPIGEWVIREACRQTRAWQLSGLPALRIAVNLSASQFRHGRLLEIVQDALADAKMDPTFLEMELTETAVMSDPEGSIKILEQLSVMGVLVSVDDFGTGYSSMSYLQRLPIDKLKIDRSFISEITTRSDDASIVRAMVLLAHSLNLKVVAEGVETLEQLEFLKSIGCDQYQGYYFSKALPPPDFEALILGLHDKDAKDVQSDMQHTHSKLSAYRRPLA